MSSDTKPLSQPSHSIVAKSKSNNSSVSVTAPTSKLKNPEWQSEKPKVGDLQSNNNRGDKIVRGRRKKVAYEEWPEELANDMETRDGYSEEVK